MHEVENFQRAADNLAAAARELRRNNVTIPRAIFTTVAATILTMAGLAAVITLALTYWP